MIDAIAIKIISDTCEKYGFTETEIKSPRRNAKYMPCRIEIAKRLKNELKFSLPEIGRWMNRDHSTIFTQLNGGKGKKAKPQ